MAMTKYATKSLAQVPACDSFDPRPGVVLPDPRRPTCGQCGHYSTATATRLWLCPFANERRIEDPRDDDNLV